MESSPPMSSPLLYSQMILNPLEGDDYSLITGPLQSPEYPFLDLFFSRSSEFAYPTYRDEPSDDDSDDEATIVGDADDAADEKKAFFQEYHNLDSDNDIEGQKLPQAYRSASARKTLLRRAIDIMAVLFLLVNSLVFLTMLVLYPVIMEI